MKKPMKYLILFLLLMATSVMAQEPDTSSALFSLREAERNFAKESVMIGRNAAFAKNVAEESALFTDKWITNGKQFSKERKAAPVVLKWEPEFMDISASGDFGISTGPWEVQEYRPNTAALATGYFLTVWKKQSDGEWKVILDGGSETPAVKSPQHRTSYPSGADKAVKNPPLMDVGILSKELSDKDKQILENWKKSPVPSTYISFLEPDARMQLNGHLPTTNKDSINSFITSLDKTLIWDTSGSGAARSGDLGYTYGLLRVQGTAAVKKGHYVRIWKKLSGDSWKIELEMINFD
jgi:ketosteroid isomerase-like protein